MYIFVEGMMVSGNNDYLPSVGNAIGDFAASVYYWYRKTFNIRRTKSQNIKWFSSRPSVAWAQAIETRCLFQNEDVVGAAPTGAPNYIWVINNFTAYFGARLILEVWRYIDRNLGENKQIVNFRVNSGIQLWNPWMDLW